MTQDLNKDIETITYNYLNLPQTVTKSNGDYIEYVYDAAGIKIRQIVHTGTGTTTTDYIGNYVYEDGQIALIQHEEGRVVPDLINGGWEYQYHIKDHLGNVRTTFTTRPKEIEFMLNYESDPNLPDDEALFEELNSIISNELFDHTDPTTTYTKSQRLTGANNSRIGSVLALPVGKGDKISAEVYAKYEAVTTTANTGLTALGTMLLNALSGGSAMVNEFGQASINNAYTGANGAIIGTSGFGPDQDGIYGFLNVLFVSNDDDPTIDASRFAFDQISSGAQQIGTSVKAPHDLLSIEDFEAPTDGIAIIYVSNEQDFQTNIYFDEMKVTVNEHPVIQSDDYYPFGLTFNSYQRVTSKQNDYLYNGKELQDELDLNWLDYGARMYDPVISRFGTQDPLAELMEDWNPYHYVFNNPISYTDPTGMMPEWHDEEDENKPLFEPRQGFDNLASTYVDKKGRIIEHVEDGDFRIYQVEDEASWRSSGKSKEGLNVIGIENPEHEYKEGDWINLRDPRQNLLAPSPGHINPDYTLESFAIPIFGWLKYLRLGKVVIQFGKNPNQIYHAFRHLDKLGLDRKLVKKLVTKDLEKAASQMVDGKPLVRVIEVSGKKIQYTAFKLQDGTINVGRMHGIN